MKKILIYFGMLSVVAITGCTKNFDDINTDPTKASSTSFSAGLLLPTAEINYANAITGYNGALIFHSLWAQVLANAEYPTYYSNGDKYVASGQILTYDASIWNVGYGNAATNTQEIINLTKGNAGLSNLSGVAMILQLMTLQLETDVYGDVPYTQALQGKAGISQPIYDKQQAIYPAMLNSLDSVLTTLDATKVIPTSDVFYKSSNTPATFVASWKKFGYSLMLRMAMRLTKIDATTAQKYVLKAVAGGTFASNADNAFISFDQANNFTNGTVNALQTAEDYAQVRWGKFLINYLKTTADPRLSVIAEVSKNGSANNANESLDGDHTAANQIGMPNGYDQNGGATDISKEPNYPGISPADPSTNTSSYTDKAFAVGKYSRPTTAIYVRNKNTPVLILTYAETELLLSEAAVRGWNVGATASVHYANAVSAALQTYATFNSAGTISATTATSYAAANPLDVSSTTNSLAQINTQFWITTGTFFNFTEAWTNWRRSGYPVLTPVNYIGNFSNGTIPRRQLYPSTEATYNTTNYNAAVNGLTGGDNWTTRVWWDK